MAPDEYDTPPAGDPSLIRPYLLGGIAADGLEPDPAGTPPEQPPSGAPSGLRPYLLTGGRVGPTDTNLEFEAQVETTPAGAAAADRLSFERRDIVALCSDPTAIAEIAAQLNLHLGVVRVLVGDLVEAGYLAVGRPAEGLERSVPIIERVIRGLQAIR